MPRFFPLVAALLAAALSAGCGGEAPPAGGGADRLAVFVSIPPQAFFLERIGGERVAVEVLVPAGQSPATYAPTARQLSRLARARAFFRIGVPFEEALLPRVRSVRPDLPVIDTRAGIALREIEGEHRHGGAEGEEEEEEAHAGAEGGKDPHTWLDPRLVIVQAETIARALGELDPANRAEYAANAAAFGEELRRLDERLRAALAPLAGRKIFVFHPAFGYFAAAYGLEQVAVETGGREPSARALADLIARARAEDARVIFVQAEFSRRAAAVVSREIGGTVVPLEPLARDYLGNLEAMADQIREALE